MTQTAVPAALSPWQAQLGLFAPDVAHSLSPLITRLAGLFGAGKAISNSLGEPDGFNGLSRRGPYERLLGSEWMLLNELPDEFMRRAISGEHSFLQTAFKDKGGQKSIVMLFDSGPMQLGAPRVAHIALLIVMAARAARSKADFYWGSLQDEKRRLANQVQPATITQLINARSSAPVSPRLLQQWANVPEVAQAGERWLITDRASNDHHVIDGASIIHVTEAPSLTERRLRVEVIAERNAPPKSALLDLPPENVCVRILRDPFKLAKTPIVTGTSDIDLSGGILTSINGRRLFLRSKRGALITFVVVNSPKAPVPGHTTFLPGHGETPIAVGTSRSKSRTLLLTSDGKSYALYKMATTRKTAIEVIGITAEEAPYAPPYGPMGSIVPQDDGEFRVAFPGKVDLMIRGRKAFNEPEPRAHEHETERLWNPPTIWANEIPESFWQSGSLWLTRENDHKTEYVLSVGRKKVEHFFEKKTIIETDAPIDLIKYISNTNQIAYVTAAGEVGVYLLPAGAQVLKFLPIGASGDAH